MSKGMLNKQVGEWRKEVARLNDLIAHDTGKPAAANKAAEEGELPLTPPDWDEWALAKSRLFVKRTEEVNHPRAMLVSSIHCLLIEAMEYADRASRQVANKAEVEPEHSQFDASKGIYWFSVLLKCARLLDLPDDEPIPSGVLKAVEALVATPPATTGASTVLTDERTGIDTHEFHYLLTEYRKDQMPAKLNKAYFAITAHIDQYVAREVAAQAGQVAVPEGLAERIKTAMKECQVGHNYDGNKLAWKLEDLLATPSPAKESK